MQKHFFLFVAVLVIASLACSRTVTVNSPVIVSDPAEATAVVESTAIVVYPTVMVVSSPTPVVVYPTNVPANSESESYRKFRLDANWIGDDFGPERTLPDTIVGPAIAELKSYRGSACAAVKVNKGETLVWPGGGAYWEAGSQLALEARWPHHVDEYLANYAECKVYVTVVSVPNPTQP